MEVKFPQGIRAFKPRENAPNFVVTELVIQPEMLMGFIENNKDLLTSWNATDQLKLTVLLSKDGTKHNIQVNTFKPTKKEDVPF